MTRSTYNHRLTSLAAVAAAVTITAATAGAQQQHPMPAPHDTGYHAAARDTGYHAARDTGYHAMAPHDDGHHTMAQDSAHTAAHAAAMHGTATHETQASLMHQATVSMDSARAVAMHEVPNGHIQSSELEREHGKLIYSFDIAVTGQTGIEEVNVDAMTGALVAHEHETPKSERAEAKQDAKAHGAAPHHAASAHKAKTP